MSVCLGLRVRMCVCVEGEGAFNKFQGNEIILSMVEGENESKFK